MPHPVTTMKPCILLSNFLVHLETALKPFLKNAAHTVMVTDDMIQDHEKHFFTEDVLVNAIIDQIMNSGFWCKEHEKLMKIEKGIW